MAIRSVSRATEAQPTTTQAAGFDQLLGRLLNLIHHVRLVDQRLSDLQEVPPELQPAGVGLHDATEALDVLYNDFDGWRVHGAAGATAAEEPEPAPQLEQRLEEQRQALWRAAVIVQCVVAAAQNGNPVDGTLNSDQASDIELALLGAHALIEDATGALEPGVLLRAAEELRS